MSSVKEAFDRAACRYDAYAEQQRAVAKRLSQLVRPNAGDWVLDVGCGTGVLKLLTDWEVVATDISPAMCEQAAARNQLVVTADLHQLPFRSNSIPMIFSSLSLQWSDDLAAALAEFKRLLVAGGYCAFSIYLSNTISELNKSFKLMNEVSPLRQFISQPECLKMINCAGFELQNAHQELLKREDNSLIELVSYMKKIGAGHSSRKTLRTRRDWQALEELYPKKDGKLISSWEVGYFVIRAPL